MYVRMHEGPTSFMQTYTWLFTCTNVVFLFLLLVHNACSVEGGGAKEGKAAAPPATEYVGRGMVHLDAFCWVQRDSYLPQGNQGLKAVTKSKLGYDPVEVSAHCVRVHRVLVLVLYCEYYGKDDNKFMRSLIIYMLFKRWIPRICFAWRKKIHCTWHLTPYPMPSPPTTCTLPTCIISYLVYLQSFRWDQKTCCEKALGHCVKPY